MEKKKITLGSVLVNLDAIITCVTLTLCTIVVNANVLMRYFLKRPLYFPVFSYAARSRVFSTTMIVS